MNPKKLVKLVLHFFFEWSVCVQVTVETLEKGFLVDVFAAKTCPGLLVSILEAFEGMGLSVLEARVSCADTFRFQAVGGEVRYIHIYY